MEAGLPMTLATPRQAAIIVYHRFDAAVVSPLLEK